MNRMKKAGYLTLFAAALFTAITIARYDRTSAAGEVLLEGLAYEAIEEDIAHTQCDWGYEDPFDADEYKRVCYDVTTSVYVIDESLVSLNDTLLANIAAEEWELPMNDTSQVLLGNTDIASVELLNPIPGFEDASEAEQLQAQAYTNMLALFESFQGANPGFFYKGDEVLKVSVVTNRLSGAEDEPIANLESLNGVPLSDELRAAFSQPGFLAVSVSVGDVDSEVSFTEYEILEQQNGASF